MSKRPRRKFETGFKMKEMEQYKKLLVEAHREIDVLKKQRELKQRHIKLNTSVITGLDLFPSKRDVNK